MLLLVAGRELEVHHILVAGLPLAQLLLKYGQAGEWFVQGERVQR